MIDAIDTLKTMYWFDYLLTKLNAKAALAVQREIDPESIQTNESKEISHSSKWAEYRRGLHVPRTKMIEKAEIRVPGSAAIFNHPLWAALKGEPISKHAVSLIKLLDASLQPMLFDIHGRLIRNSNGHFLGKLERRANLDVLAALTILMKLNHEDGSHEIVWEYGHSVYRVLLIVIATMNDSEIAQLICDQYSTNIFTLMTQNGTSYTIDQNGLVLISAALDLMMEKYAKRILLPQQQSKLMLDIIRGKYAAHMHEIFAPKLIQLN